MTVSGKPPLFVIITAQPLAEASKLVLPKGSFHLEQTTDILVDLRKFKILLTHSSREQVSVLTVRLGLSGIFLFGPTDPSKVGPVFDHQRVIKKSEMTEINPSLIIEMLKEESFG